MDRSLADKIVEFLHHWGFDATLHESYSGRGMFGTTCLAIDTDAKPAQFGYIVAEAQHYLDREADITVLPSRTDNLGHNTIYY